MEYKTLIGGEKIPALGLGTWLIGGAQAPDYSKDEDQIAAIKKAIELGYTLIDTAEMYGAGHCEELVGQAIKGVPRKQVFIVTKVLKSNLRRADVQLAARRSLQRLGVNQLDLYLVHAPNPEIPIEETMAAMNSLVNDGLVRYIGVSNFNLEQLKEAQAASKHPIVVNQIEYSLATRNTGRYHGNTNMESEMIPYCQSNGIVIMAERPIERGTLARADNSLMAELSAKYDKTPAQIALNWLISKQGIVAIPKSTSEIHLRENLGALGWTLTKQDQTRLDEIKF